MEVTHFIELYFGAQLYTRISYTMVHAEIRVKQLSQADRKHSNNNDNLTAAYFVCSCMPRSKKREEIVRIFIWRTGE